MNIRWILLGTGMIAVSLLRAASPPVDFLPGTVEGFLPNGLHYLVLPNSEPVHNVELRLVMRVAQPMLKNQYGQYLIKLAEEDNK